MLQSVLREATITLKLPVRESLALYRSMLKSLLNDMFLTEDASSCGPAGVGSELRECREGQSARIEKLILVRLWQSSVVILEDFISIEQVTTVLFSTNDDGPDT